MRNKTFVFLAIIFIVASVLRFWQLGETPISPDWDEVSLGYNAYSIMQTGKDEYGEPFPIVLRSFDDYKPALYTYLSMPSISILGLSAHAVRLPSAIFGLITVIATFFLVNELFKRKDLGLLSSFLLAISPWHIQFSRIAFESNVGLAFNVLSILFFIKGLKSPAFLILSAALAGLNLYVYQNEKIFTPLLFLIAFIIFRKELFTKPKKYIVSGLVVGFLIILPMAGYVLTNENALGRAKGVSIFGEPYPRGLAQKILDDKERGDLIGMIFDNRRIVYAKTIVSGYISHFDLNWLFIRGDIARHHAPNMGLLYLFELPFLLMGIYGFIFGKLDKKGKILIISWFLIAPLAASVTTGVPHAVRTLNFLPTFQIFTATGILLFFSMISNLKYKEFSLKPSMLLIFVLLLTFNFVYYLNQYFVQQNYFNAKEWQYGYEKLSIPEITSGYKRVIVSNQAPMDQSYMFFLFYLKYDPSLYQQEAKYSSGGFRENHSFGKFEFRPIRWEDETRDPNTLYIGRASDFPTNASLIKAIDYPDGTEAMKVVK